MLHLFLALIKLSLGSLPDCGNVLVGGNPAAKAAADDTIQKAKEELQEAQKEMLTVASDVKKQCTDL